MNLKQEIYVLEQKLRHHLWLFILLLLLQAAFFVAAYFLLSYYQLQLTQAMGLVSQSDPSSLVASFNGFITTINSLLLHLFMLFGLFHATLWAGTFMIVRMFSWRDAGRAFITYTILFVAIFGPVVYWARVILGNIITLSAEESLARTGYMLLGMSSIGYLMLLFLLGFTGSHSFRGAWEKICHALRHAGSILLAAVLIFGVVAGSLLLAYLSLLTERLMLFIPAALLVVVVLVLARIFYLITLHSEERP